MRSLRRSRTWGSRSSRYIQKQGTAFNGLPFLLPIQSVHDPHCGAAGAGRSRAGLLAGRRESQYTDTGYRYISWWLFRWLFVPDKSAGRCNGMHRVLEISAFLSIGMRHISIMCKNLLESPKSDLKSADPKGLWGFKSPSRHHNLFIYNYIIGS